MKFDNFCVRTKRRFNSIKTIGFSVVVGIFAKNLLKTLSSAFTLFYTEVNHFKVFTLSSI